MHILPVSKKRGMKLHYICFADNSLLFPTVKKFHNWSTVDEVIAKSLTPPFFKTQCIHLFRVTIIHLKHIVADILGCRLDFS